MPRVKNRKNNKIRIVNAKRLMAIALFIAVFFGITFSQSKYKSQTLEEIITIITKYHVNYQTTGGKIKEPEKFSSYVSQTGLVLPVEGEVSRVSYDFEGWYDNNNFTGDAIKEIKSGEEGDKLFFAAWNVSQYPLKIQRKDQLGNTVNGLPDGWDLVIGKTEQGNDNIIELDSNGTTIVGKGETVSFRTSYSEDPNLKGWAIDEDIVFSERYETGDQYIYYDFTMPRHAVTAIYGGDNDGYIDLAKSPITFEENVDIGSRLQNGFWYKSTISGMIPIMTDAEKGNFYVWDNNEPLFVTSKGVPTQNQITIVGGTTLYLKDCVMAVTDDYSNDVVDRKIKDVVMETKSQGAFADTEADAWKNYGNIIISYSQYSTYTTNIHIVGENNTIGAIFTNQYYKNKANKMIVNVTGTNNTTDKIYLASVWGNMDIKFTDLEVEQYKNNTSVQAEYPDNSEYLTWISSGALGSGNVTFTKCNVNIPEKRVYDAIAYIYFYGTVGTVGSIRSAYKVDVSSSGSIPSNVLVLGDVYVFYYGSTINGSSKLVVEGSYRINGYSSSGTTISSKCELIVKGNIFDAGSLTMSGGTLIANAIVLGSSASISSNSKIITNIITNSPNGRPTFDSTTGQYTTTFGGTNALKLTSSNDDNIPFRNYTNYNSAQTTSTTFNFSGGNIYLYGYYETDDGKFSNTFTAKSEGNPLKDIVLEYEENGLTNITDTYLENKLIPTNNETIILGNSANDLRIFKFSGANIYSAGNMTLYNNAVISAGNLNVMGILSSKKDMDITGGTITANEIGNAYNLITTTNSLNSWKSINITGGNITTNKIGAITRKINNVAPKSSVSIGPDATFNAKDNSNIEIVSDVYVNYIYNDLYTNDANNPNSIRFNGTLTNGTNKELQSLEVTSPTLTDNKVTIIKPTLNETGELQKWKYNSLNGTEATYIDKNGYLNGDNTTDPLYLNSQINLYAAKENYNLTVNGENYSVTSNNENVTFTDNTAEVKADSTIVLTIQDVQMTPKTVIWYYDDSGVLHNAIKEADDIDYTNGTITFTMPCADTEIYITDNLTLDIYKHDVTFTKDGFAIEYDTERREDSNFSYTGNITVSQSNISRIISRSYVMHGMTGSGYFTNPFIIYDSNNKTAAESTYKMKFESGSDTLNRTITLEKIKQKLTSYGIYIEDGENVEINIKGNVHIYPIYLTENSNLTVNGTDNNSDILKINEISSTCIGNASGKVGNINFNNIWLVFQTRLVYSNAKSNSQVIFNNVKMDAYNYATSGIVRNMTNVVFNNSDIMANAGGDTAGALFSAVTNLTFNNTLFNYTSGGGRGYYNLFREITNMYIKGNSSIVYNLRNSTDATASYEDNSYSTLATLVELSDTASMSIDHRVRLKKLKVNDNASFTVDKLGTSEADIEKSTYLLASEIQVNGGLVQADNIIISGYYAGSSGTVTTESAVLDVLKNNENILDGTSYAGLVVNGGIVRANNFVGGDVNGKINVNGGTLEALGIGTSGKLYGYASYLPKVGEEYVYSIDKIPSYGTVVNINGGTVNVLENGYLGGMRATVNVNGGNVNLQENALIGINESDTTTIVNSITSQGNIPSELVDINIQGGTITGNEGYINTPYTTFTVDSTSSNPSINLKDIKAESGTVKIESTSNHYDNPTGSGERVGTLICNAIIAKDIIIDNKAVVYANSVTSKTNSSSEVGQITIGKDAYLYTSHYGTEGNGTTIITIEGTIVGNRQYTIQYVMNDTYTDSATNPNPESYVYGTGLVLAEPTRFGYTFDGWYDNNGNQITEITSTDTGDKVLNARWTAQEVEFVIKIKAEDVGLTNEEFAEEVDLSLGSLNQAGDTFTYTEHVKISYNALMNTGLLLSKYNLATYAASAARIDNSTLNPDEDILNLTSNGATITRAIMEYYLNNSSTPINIDVCEFIYTAGE